MYSNPSFGESGVVTRLSQQRYAEETYWGMHKSCRQGQDLCFFVCFSLK